GGEAPHRDRRRAEHLVQRERARGGHARAGAGVLSQDGYGRALPRQAGSAETPAGVSVRARSGSRRGALERLAVTERAPGPLAGPVVAAGVSRRRSLPGALRGG